MVIAANVDAMFRRLTQAMGQPHLADDPRFVTHIARGENAELLDSMIATWSASLDVADLTARLEQFGVVFGPINSIAEVVQDPHFRERGMVRDHHDDDFGTITVPGVFPVLSETPGDIAWLGPQQVGAHNAEIYARIGLGEETIEDLKVRGVI